jgi:hypothetical protein
MRVQKCCEQHSIDTVIVQFYRRRWERLSFGQGWHYDVSEQSSLPLLRSPCLSTVQSIQSACSQPAYGKAVLLIHTTAISSLYFLNRLFQRRSVALYEVVTASALMTRVLCGVTLSRFMKWLCGFDRNYKGKCPTVWASDMRILSL